MAKRNLESFDPRNFNAENLPQICGNDVFEQIEEYKKIESLRLRKPDQVESPTPISNDSTPSNGMNGTNGSSLSSYIPRLFDPVKILCCKVHIFRDNAGQGHFQRDDAWRVINLFNWANMRYEHPAPPSDMPNPPPVVISDTRVRFTLSDGDIEYYDDSTLNVTISQSLLEAAALARNPKTLDFINVYMTAGSMGGAGGFANPPSFSLGWNSWVVQLGAPPAQSDPNYLGNDWVRAGNLAHELGHVLNLAHTYLGGGASADCTIGPDFLYDVFGTNPSTCPHVCSWGVNASIQETPGPNSVITNNLMGGNKDSSWISGLQGARMHQALEQMSVKRYIATGCNDCLCCVAFMVRGINHVSSGSHKVTSYATIALNEGWGWTAGLNAFVVPVSGIYNFDVSFMGSASGGTSSEAFMLIQKNGSAIARARNGAATGQHSAASVSVNVRLQAGDMINTAADSITGTTRNIVEYNFQGHLICGCC